MEHEFRCGRCAAMLVIDTETEGEEKICHKCRALARVPCFFNSIMPAPGNEAISPELSFLQKITCCLWVILHDQILNILLHPLSGGKSFSQYYRSRIQAYICKKVYLEKLRRYSLEAREFIENI